MSKDCHAAGVSQKPSMKAIVQRAYGSADVLEFVDIDKPILGDDDVLIRVHAAGLHVGDRHVMTGRPYLLRLIGFGILAPKVLVRGMDVAGTVEAVGKNVTEFRQGDEVFGTCEGAFAEYARGPARNFAPKPRNLTFEQAAAVPTSGFAALQALRNRGEIQSAQEVLIVGATGGVGTFAAQLAKAFGAEVTGVCRTAKIDWLRSQGADHVVDYTQEDFAQSDRRYDLVLDVGGSRRLSDLRRVLKPRGTLVMVGGEGGDRVLGDVGKWIHALVLSPFVNERLRPLSTAPNKTDLLLLKEFAESGLLRPAIDKIFALSATADAFRYLGKGEGRGKVVITV
jgi:NADPH:quinone reductase-like Zn-dependent oxidoreductase